MTTFFILTTATLLLTLLASIVIDVRDALKKQARIRELEIKLFHTEVEQARVERERDSMRADWNQASKRAAELEQQRRRVAEAIREERLTLWKVVSDIEKGSRTIFDTTSSLDEFIQKYAPDKTAEARTERAWDDFDEFVKEYDSEIELEPADEKKTE